MLLAAQRRYEVTMADKRRVTVRVDSLHTDLEKQAERNDRTVSDQVRHYVRRGLQEDRGEDGERSERR